MALITFDTDKAEEVYRKFVPPDGEFGSQYDLLKTYVDRAFDDWNNNRLSRTIKEEIDYIFKMLG